MRSKGRKRLVVLTAVLLALSACGDGDAGSGAGGDTTDAGTRDGGQQPDAASNADAQAPTDAADAGAGDVGPPPDGSSGDGGPSDSRPPADAAPPADSGREYEDASQPPIEPRFAEVAAAFEAQMQGFGAPGAALALIEGGQVTFARGFGVRHPDRPAPVGPATRFRIASCTKTLTAVALLRLVDEGRVDLNEPITTYVPDFRLAQDESWAPSILVRHLIEHATGIYDYLELNVQPRFNGDDGLQRYLLGRYAAVGYLMAPSGRMYNYSNPNFALAALVQEVVSGVPYRIYLQDEVLRPLGMDRTVVLPDEVLADDDYATGLSRDGAGGRWLAEPDTYDNGWGRPAGFVFSTVEDMAAYVQFLRAGAPEVLGPELHAAMQQPQRPTEEVLDFTAYGFGLLVHDGWFCGEGATALCTTRQVHHNGAIPGFSSEFWYLPELDFGMVTLASTDGAYFGNTFVLAARTLAGLGPGGPLPEAFGMSPDDYDRYAGEFTDNFSFGAITVTRSGRRLLVEMPDLDAAEVDYEATLEPMWRDNFVLNVQGHPMQATFLFDEAGKVEYLRTRYAVGRRVEEAEQAKAKTQRAGIGGSAPPQRPLPGLPHLLRRLPEEGARVRRLLRAFRGERGAR